MNNKIKAHSLNKEEVAEKLDTSIDKGLTKEEVDNRLEKFGLNELVETKKKTALDILLNQFKDFLVYLLFFAIAISVIIGLYEQSQGKQPTEYIDAIVILTILIINAILGFYQEFNAEKALESLKKMAPHDAKVIRDGKLNKIDIKYIVPGDLIKIEEGDKIPADARLVEAFSLNIDEASLTGESTPVHKKLEPVDEDTILADKKNMVFSNTIVTRGNGLAITIATGMDTEIGKIAEKIQTEDTPSPFQLEIADFGKKLGKFIFLLCGLFFVISLISILWENSLSIGEKEIEGIINSLSIAISLAVAAVPEGLIVVITVVMSIGMIKMAKRNALVKNLNAVETLGRINIVCTDKTGTLTKNEMTAVKIFVAGKEYKVGGTGYEISGKILNDSGNPVEMTSTFERFLEVCKYCNNSTVRKKEDSEKTEVIGDPTEIALKVLAMKMDIGNEIKKLDEIPFDSDRKMMSVAIEKNGKKISLIKGAPDVLLEKASKILINGQEKPASDAKNIILEKNKAFAENALRVLGIAFRPLQDNYQTEDMEKDFTILGLIGIIDPAREEVKKSIDLARNAGIRTIMITGDHKITALAIAKEIGLTDNNEALTGSEIEKLDEQQLEEKLNHIDVYSRVTSEQKLRLLKNLKSQGKIVSMTGDGVNDAPALKGAHVGVAMGITGTEVTQEAADVILLDDNYSTIINAIEEGRGIFETTKGFFKYMLTTNLAEVVIIITAWVFMKLFVNVFLAQPLEPIQILWINVVTDGIPAIALGFTPTDPDVMKAKPREGFNIFSDIRQATLFGSLIVTVSVLVLYIFSWSIFLPFWSTFDPGIQQGATLFPNTIFEYSLTAFQYQVALVQTMILLTIIFNELFYIYSCTSETKPFWDFPNKHLFWATGISFGLFLLLLFTPLNFAFRIVPLIHPIYWITAFFFGFLIIPCEELRKYLIRRNLVSQQQMIKKKYNSKF